MIHQSQRLSSAILCHPRRTMEAASSYSESTCHRDMRASSPSQTMKSQSIPISSSHFHRTASEIQLCLDEQIAEQRDSLFYSRVIHGIQESQMYGKNRNLQMQNQMCLVHVMQTRADKATTFSSLPKSTTTSLMKFTHQDVEDIESSIGLPIETDPSSPELSTPDYSQLTSEALSLANMDLDQDMIFDLDL
eukprot:CAMPEP_0176166318 /NCGR_PEP_ID=MMETSP0120_2-20121206/85060_1 /TAXON_ID=160619 /ORGANISM="Kryptoperidinium foliaceum, Strain CCMP 1326" /LENGTH=190 /DNA_ID=CAMNT_0017503853 /DNA_START=385 /DNA_END=957 /DNA_ORIENTATION=+